MTHLDRLADLVGCTIVHVDRSRGLVVFWSGGAAFLEYGIDLVSGKLLEEDAWSVNAAPKTVVEATAVARLHYGLLDL